jgi:hypothetical protein
MTDDEVDEVSDKSEDLAEFTIIMHDDPTGDHAMQLLVTGKKKGCPDLKITCKPTLVSCTPVTQCVAFDIVPPGCSPLLCPPVTIKSSE